MSQINILGEDLERVVNVAQIPQLSPFRYPGGKTWLVPRVRHWLMSLPEPPAIFVEPFAGGGIVSLTVAAERFAEHVLMVELDDQVAAVWKTIMGRNWKWLADRITSFDLTYEHLKEALSKSPKSVREKAFQTVLKNRTYHGGILADGSGVLKHGENGRGIHSRWYPDTIRKRIFLIQEFKSRIEFVEGDGLTVMEQHIDEPGTVFFIDPPYTAGGKRAGKRLYRYNELDHARLFDLAKRAKGDCLLTYDDAPEVRSLAEKYGFDTRLIAMQNTHLAKMKELLIGKSLDWLN